MLLPTFPAQDCSGTVDNGPSRVRLELIDGIIFLQAAILFHCLLSTKPGDSRYQKDAGLHDGQTLKSLYCPQKRGCRDTGVYYPKEDLLTAREEL